LSIDAPIKGGPHRVWQPLEKLVLCDVKKKKLCSMHSSVELSYNYLLLPPFIAWHTDQPVYLGFISFLSTFQLVQVPSITFKALI